VASAVEKRTVVSPSCNLYLSDVVDLSLSQPRRTCAKHSSAAIHIDILWEYVQLDVASVDQDATIHGSEKCQGNGSNTDLEKMLTA
jgi:hypothetical protein